MWRLGVTRASLEGWEWQLGFLPAVLGSVGSVFFGVLSNAAMWVFLGPGLFLNPG